MHEQSSQLVEASGLTETQLEAVERLVCPEYSHCSQEEHAVALGVNRRTLWKWRKKPAFKKAMAALQREKYQELLPLATSALIKEVKGGDVQAIKLLYQLAGQLDAETRHTHITGIKFVIETPQPIESSQDSGEAGQQPIIDIQPG